MVNPLDYAPLVIALLLAAWVLKTFAWRAVICLSPASVELAAEAPADKMKLPHELQGLEKAVASLGFRPVGSHYEKPRFTQETVSYDYAHEKDKGFATLYVGGDARARLYFISRTKPAGALVITANYRRPAREVPGRYFSAGLEDMPADRLYKAHLRRVAAFGEADAKLDLDGRLELAREWFNGSGRPELRQQNVLGLLWSVGALGMVGAAALRLMKGH